MQMIWTSDGQYQKVEYANEADLESAIAKVQGEFFGAK